MSCRPSIAPTFARKLRARSPAAPSGFTLIELLVVIAVIAILAALLFPAFTRAKAASRNAVCVSNLKQIGTAIQTYAQDWDGLYPIGLDFADTTPEGRAGWARFPEALNPEAKQLVDALAEMPNRGGYVDQRMKGYTESQKVWHCPADTGLQYRVILDGTFGLTHGAHTDGMPAYDVFDLSYGYRTELGVAGWNVDQGKEVANLVVIADMAGYWHTRHSRNPNSEDDVADTEDVKKWALNVLYGDGHVKYTSWADYKRAWDTVGPYIEWYNDQFRGF